MSQWMRAGLAVALAGGLGLCGVAFAHGPMGLPMFGGDAPSFFSEPPQSAPRLRPSHYEEEEDSRPRAKASHGSVAHRGGGAAVCVRLCDGFFFPTQTSAGGDAACAAQCPDAPTALYTMTSDRIDDAVSLTGALYSKLPVAKRYETVSDATCSCHREGFASRAKQILTDPTLHKGDVVMTADGFRVYEGGYGKTGPQAFVAMSQAPDLSKDLRGTLTAMEKASAGSPTTPAPAVLVARPKGNVTVDDGAAPPSP